MKLESLPTSFEYLSQDHPSLRRVFPGCGISSPRRRQTSPDRGKNLPAWRSYHRVQSEKFPPPPETSFAALAKLPGTLANPSGSSESFSEPSGKYSKAPETFSRHPENFSGAVRKQPNRKTFNMLRRKEPSFIRSVRVVSWIGHFEIRNSQFEIPPPDLRPLTSDFWHFAIRNPQFEIPLLILLSPTFHPFIQSAQARRDVVRSPAMSQTNRPDTVTLAGIRQCFTASAPRQLVRGRSGESNNVKNHRLSTD